MIYDFSSSLDLFELEAEIIENSREKNGKIIISVEKFNELFSQTFEIDPDYYQPQEVFESLEIRLLVLVKLQNESLIKQVLIELFLNACFILWHFIIEV